MEQNGGYWKQVVTYKNEWLSIENEESRSLFEKMASLEIPTLRL